MRILLTLVFAITLVFTSALTLNHKENDDSFKAAEVEAKPVAADTAERLRYYVYTRENRRNPQAVRPNVESVKQTLYNSRKPTAFSIHGILSNKDSEENQVIVPAKLDQEDCNVIVVDYSNLYEGSIERMIAMVPDIGEAIANFIVLLHDNFGARYEQFHIVGFSLGAQIAGFTGKNVQRKTNYSAKLQRITGLDPASARNFNKENERLAPSDAHFVDVVHTNGADLGYFKPCGHADYYPNGGLVQPNCRDSTCSHLRAYQLVREMWSGENRYISARCSSVDNMSRDKCTWGNVRMGLNTVEHGIFYLETNSRYPFGKGTVAHKFF